MNTAKIDDLSLDQTTDAIGALIALAGNGDRLHLLADHERRGYFDLLGMLAGVQRELVAGCTVG